MSQRTGSSEPGEFSTDLTDFLVEFSIALNRTSMYPAGHPWQERSAADVVQRLAALLQERPSISIGFAKQQIVIEGIASNPAHPVLRSLAERFHRQHIGAVTFQRGVTPAELASAMQLVGLEGDKGAKPLGLGDPDGLKQWPNIRFFALTYDQLELVDKPDAEEGDEAAREQGARSAQLWMGLARAALASESNVEILPEATEPAVVAKAINEHDHAEAYDQVVVGYLLQIAQELKNDGGSSSAAVRRRMSRLISGLDPDTLKRLVDMGGNLTQRQRFATDAADTLGVDAVIEIVRAAADSSGQTISSSLMRMLSKLSSFAEAGTEMIQARADEALRDQVRELIQDWSLADPNPDAYTQALQSMAMRTASPVALADAYTPEPIRIIQTAIEVDSVGIAFWRAVAQLELEGGVAQILATVSTASAGNSVTEALWQHFATEQTLRLLLASATLDFDHVDALLNRMSAEMTTGILLDALSESESRATRMGLVRRLAKVGREHPDQLVERMTDPRWYVRRNILAMFNEMQLVPAGLAPSDHARDSDPRVRREALQLWTRMPAERDRALVAGLKDTDDRAVRSALAIVAKEGLPEAGVPVIASRMGDRTLTTDVRLQFVRLLGRVNSPLALDTLIKVVVTGKTFFRAPKLADATPVVVVALSTLAEKWSSDPRVKPILARARKSKDKDLRAAVTKPVST